MIRKTPSFIYRNTFSHVIHELYLELSKRKFENDPSKLIIGVNMLLHIFRIGCIRNYDMVYSIYLCKKSIIYFFEYLHQLQENKLEIDYVKMNAFIYDKTIGTIEETIPMNDNNNAEEMREELDILPEIISFLPPITEQPTLLQLQNLWLKPEERTKKYDMEVEL